MTLLGPRPGLHARAAAERRHLDAGVVGEHPPVRRPDEAAGIGTGIALLALWPLRIFADFTIDRFRHESTRIILEVEPGAVDGVLDLIAKRGRRIQRFDIEHEGERRRLIFNLDRAYPGLISELAEVQGVQDVGWER